MEDGLLKKTGKSLEHWIQVVRNSGLEKHTEILKFLKSDHGFTHGFANFVSLKARKTDAGSHDADDLVTSQYKGKEILRPIYDRVLEMVKPFGTDIEIVPKMKSVSLRRKKQFALVQPSTKTRVDLGLKIKGKEPAGRLENSGPFGAMCTHRIRLNAAEEVDEEVVAFLLEAYEAAG